MEKKLNPLQKMFIRNQGNSSQRLQEFYENMMKASNIPEKYREKGLTPERVASDYLSVITSGYGYEYGHDIPTFIYEYAENGDDYRLTLNQGSLSDYEIFYYATRLKLEKNDELLKDTVMGASLLVDTEATTVFEYARITYGEDVYAHLMELAAKGIESLDDVPCDAKYDSVHRKNQRKFDSFMKLDRTARKMYKEVRALNKEKRAYDRTRKAIDIKNDERKQRFNKDIVVKNNNMTPTIITKKAKESGDREL